MSNEEAINPNSSHHDGKLLLTIPDVADCLGLGRSFVYERVRKGEIKSLKIGRARRVPVRALEEFVTSRVLQTD